MNHPRERFAREQWDNGIESVKSNAPSATVSDES
ncbi:DUF1508 domain-containing protein [Flavobacterium sp. CYK-55]